MGGGDEMILLLVSCSLGLKNVIMWKGSLNDCDKNETVFLNADSVSWESIFLYFEALKAYFSLGCCQRKLFKNSEYTFSSVQFSCSVVSDSFDPMNRSMPGLPVYHQLPMFTQTHVHWVIDAIQPSHSLSSPSPPAPNPFQNQGLFQWVNSSHEVAKVLQFQL